MKRLLLLTFLLILHISISEAQRFSILSYNIYHGENPSATGEPTLDSIADYLVLVQPEAVALQELDSMTLRSARIYGEKINLIAQLSRATGYQGYFGRSIEFEEGAYGNGVLTKKSTGFHTFQLPSPAGGEARTAVWSQLILSTSDEIFMGSVHLDHEYEENRIAQIDTLIAYASSLSLPAIIAGDFNFSEGSEPYNRIPPPWKDAGKEAGNPNPTYPGDDSVGQRIDYLFYDSTYFQLVNYQVIPLPFSDHYAILITLDLIKNRKD